MNTPHAVTPTDNREPSFYDGYRKAWSGEPEEIPSWAKWLATDADGNVWCYECRPELCPGANAWSLDVALSRFAWVESTKATTDWRHSLVRIGPDEIREERLAALMVAGVICSAVVVLVVGRVWGWW